MERDWIDDSISFYENLGKQLRQLREREMIDIGQDSPALSVGDIVCVTAHDWGMYNEQINRDTEFDVVRGKIYGEIVRVFDSGIAIAPQVFDDGGVRCVLTVPWSVIEDYKVWHLS